MRMEMGTYNDFSQLKKLKPAAPVAPKPAQPQPPADRALAGAANSADYFSSLLGPREVKKKKKPAASGVPQLRTTVVTPATMARVREEQTTARIEALEAAAAARETALQEELAVQKEACVSLATDLAEANEARANAESALAQTQRDLAAALATPKEDPPAVAELAASRAELATSRADLAQAQEQLAATREQLAQLQKELTRVNGQLAEAMRTSLSSAVLLDKPTGLAEKFTGEVHAHVVEALTDAYRAAEAAGRERRARILESVLAANPSLGELDERRAAVRQIVKEAGATLDNAALADLEKLGFRYISGNKHHKLDWAGIRFPLAKTPSDYRACLNAAAEINNRVF